MKFLEITQTFQPRIHFVLPQPCDRARFPSLVDFIIVARVRPRTSKGITDLLLPYASSGYPPVVPLRSHLRRALRPVYNVYPGIILPADGADDYLKAKVSFVIAIKQTNHSTN